MVYGGGFEHPSYLALEGSSRDGSEPWSPGGNSADRGSGGCPWLAVLCVCHTSLLGGINTVHNTMEALNAEAPILWPPDAELTHWKIS